MDVVVLLLRVWDSETMLECGRKRVKGGKCPCLVEELPERLERAERRRGSARRSYRGHSENREVGGGEEMSVEEMVWFTLSTTLYFMFPWIASLAKLDRVSLQLYTHLNHTKSGNW